MDKVRIIAIPFAGGNRYSFGDIEKHIVKKIEWITLELPGRGGRFKESLLTSVEEMADDLFQKIVPHILKEGEYIIYGHSLGTILGYELTRRIRSKGLKQPSCLFFTGRGAPGFERCSKKRSHLPKDEFWEEIDQIGGLPSDFFEHKELLDLYYPIMKSDFKAVENYEFKEMDKPFSMPIHICMGEDEIGEEDDDKTPLPSMKAWANESTAVCTFELLDGDHFFILNHSNTIADKIYNAAVSGKVVAH
ncbi:Surfactin synthase thioesterase subunit [Tenacibaculum sp. MAR_2009_124]|uniref:thioesterase II family protein n=1 Tax=Tenacibaculum sp. MAR_2009_124 TaxID=1250059 RepID=UPI000896F81C|nr:thioesterase domain-containing protein [Tenacibaculum sp. MAR_2009_124]SEB35138.1 Surfactin synthase thioesterase subunit [Tenacibaculum sp. MAR_2009_124]